MSGKDLIWFINVDFFYMFLHMLEGGGAWFLSSLLDEVTDPVGEALRSQFSGFLYQSDFLSLCKNAGRI